VNKSKKCAGVRLSLPAAKVVEIFAQSLRGGGEARGVDGDVSFVGRDSAKDIGRETRPV
jgi:hypothetical protein